MNANYTKEACYFAFECTVGPLHMLRWLTSRLQCRPTLFVFEDASPGGEGGGYSRLWPVQGHTGTCHLTGYDFSPLCPEQGI